MTDRAQKFPTGRRRAWLRPLRSFLSLVLSAAAITLISTATASAHPPVVPDETSPELAEPRLGEARSSHTDIALAVTCLGGNGRVDVNFTNLLENSAVFRVELGSLSPRQVTVAGRDWGRVSITGRQDGVLDLRLSRNGATLRTTQVSIECDTSPPSIHTPTVQVVNACREGNGYIIFQLANDSAESRPWVIEFEGVQNRSTTTAPWGAAVRGVTGRPDGTYDVVLRSGSERIERTVDVNCDGEPASDRCSDPDARIQDCQMRQGVLSIRMLPTDPDNPEMMDPWTGLNKTVADQRLSIIDSEHEAMMLLTEGTRYRGHSNPSAPPSLIYEYVDEIELDLRPPEGLEVPWKPGEGIYRPDYNAILTRPDIDICSLIDSLDVDEVWLWTQHHGSIEPAESNMSSPTGQPFLDISNSEGSDDLPHCSETYVLYNLNYVGNQDNILHNHGHHMERMLSYWPNDRQVFRFDGYLSEDPAHPHLPTNPNGYFRCGSVHYAPNTADPSEEYISWVDREVLSDCATWTPDGGTPELVSCETWFEALYDDPSCWPDGQRSFQVWWFQNLPGFANGILHNDQQMRNAWDTIGDPDSLIDDPSWLYEALGGG